MALALDSSSARPQLRIASLTGWTGVAGLTSLAAGAIHAAAIGVHAEHRAAALTFTVLAALQLAWGGLALLRSGRVVAALGGAISVAAVAGWVLAKTTGITPVAGLDVAEPVQTADALAAGLALVTIGLVALALATEGRRRPARRPMTGAAVLVTALAVTGMVSGGTHVHAHGTGDGDHGGLAAGDDHHDAELVASDEEHGDGDHQAVAPVPYDPTKPIDLGGVDGVTPEQQAAAENLVAVTLVRLPKWSDAAVAEAAGFRSIGDGFTGIEHLVHPGFMDDDVILDPDQPESLVYDTSDGGRRLVAAMYMVKRGTPLSEVPDIGGPLMQWHTHENLCYNDEGKVRGITDEAGNCPAGLVKPVPTPMIHVWIEPHPCGPFAALEGIAGGTVPEGEEVLCDHAHGAP